MWGDTKPNKQQAITWSLLAKIPSLYCKNTLHVIGTAQFLCAQKWWIVTGFGKMCIVHTSNFSTLVSHKIYLEWWIDVKLSGIVELLFLYDSWKFHICIPFPVVFMNLQMSKIGCVNMHTIPNPVTIYGTHKNFLRKSKVKPDFKQKVSRVKVPGWEW